MHALWESDDAPRARPDPPVSVLNSPDDHR